VTGNAGTHDARTENGNALNYTFHLDMRCEI